MAGRIRVLDEVTRNQIAAGEVIERPASVIKELVENSLDAGATVLDIELHEGGMAFIEVTDNGCGMDAEDLPIAALRHATSKISSVEDLFNVRTLGFRGEALASIASVSHLGIQSKTSPSKYGTRIKLEGGVQAESKRVGCATGTRVTVEALFYNVPPRKKYLKQVSTEFGHCLTVVQEAALAYPQTRFNLLHNGKAVFQSAGNGQGRDVLVSRYGRGVIEDILPVTYQTAEGAVLAVHGWVSKPTAHRSARDRQTFFINGRAVRVPMLARSVEQAYKDTMPQGRYPLAVLFITLPPESVDVNVHPAKREVKFAQPGLVFDVVKQVVRGALAQSDPHSFSMAALATRKTFVSPDQTLPQSPPALFQTQAAWTEGHHHVWHAEVLGQGAALTVKNDYRENSEDEKSILWEPRFQLDHTFIVAEGAEGLVLIDQHVAHERVLYDRFKRAQAQNQISTQTLLTPLVIELGTEERLALLDQAEALRGFGYELENFGETALLLRSVPAGLEKADHVAALKEFAADLIGKGGGGNVEQLRDDILIMMSCKGAIKAGDPIDLSGARSLIADLIQSANPYTCPHGRPIVLQFSNERIRRMFGR